MSCFSKRGDPDARRNEQKGPRDAIVVQESRVLIMGIDLSENYERALELLSKKGLECEELQSALATVNDKLREAAVLGLDVSAEGVRFIRESKMANDKLKALEERADKVERERDGWHRVVRECERLFKTPDTAESALMSNLPNLIRNALGDISTLRQQIEEGK